MSENKRHYKIYSYCGKPGNERGDWIAKKEREYGQHINDISYFVKKRAMNPIGVFKIKKIVISIL